MIFDIKCYTASVNFIYLLPTNKSSIIIPQDITLFAACGWILARYFNIRHTKAFRKSKVLPLYTLLLPGNHHPKFPALLRFLLNITGAGDDNACTDFRGIYTQSEPCPTLLCVIRTDLPQGFILGSI